MNQVESDWPHRPDPRANNKYRLIPTNKEDANDEYHPFDENMNISSL